MRKLLFTLILILAAYVGYQYYFGKEEDKANARVIVQETKDLGKAVSDLLKRQKEKYNDGDFDKVIDDIRRTLDKLKTASPEDRRESRDHLKQLEDELKAIDPQKLSEENRNALKKVMEEIHRQGE